MAVAPNLPDDTLLLLNRAMLVAHGVRTAAHELNNVFQMISGVAELLEGNPTVPPDIKAKLASIRRQVTRGESVVRSMADLNRREPAGVKPVDVHQAVQAAVESRRYEHGRAGTTVTVDAVGADSWLVRAEPAALRQVILSLLINAEQAVAGRRDGTIAVTLTRHADGIEVVVADNGAPAPAAAGDPFTPFATTKPAELAAGLGLTAARILAAALGGSVDLAVSGEGGVARLDLPLSGVVAP